MHCCEGKNRISITLCLIALVLLIYSLWTHSWKGIVLAVIIVLVGHLLQAFSGKKAGRARRRR